MGVFRFSGKVLNMVVGGTAKGGVKLISQAVSMKNKNAGRYIDELGGGVIEASKQAVDSVAQFTDGTFQGVYGVIKNEPYHKQQGWDDIKD